jgi:UDP-N-acetyl-D-mannosaminuronate dehydrogenase
VTERTNVLVVGLGEVGKPLLSILSQHYEATGIDKLLPTEPVGHVDAMHICYPFQIPDFIGETVRYINLFKPGLTVINSTVTVGTTRAIAERAGVDVVHSPVRGKHARMQAEMQQYTKFIGALGETAARAAVTHFASAGFKTRVLSSPETTELAKLTETTYLGVLIAWAQEVERYCDQANTDYNEVTSFYEEIGFFPAVKYFPGIIGGHCVMPNIEILKSIFRSELLEAIQASNETKIERESSENKRREQAA